MIVVRRRDDELRTRSGDGRVGADAARASRGSPAWPDQKVEMGAASVEGWSVRVFMILALREGLKIEAHLVVVRQKKGEGGKGAERGARAQNWRGGRGTVSFGSRQGRAKMT